MRIEQLTGSGTLTEERRATVHSIFSVYRDGFYTTGELNRELDKEQIRGTFSGGARSGHDWQGYDYQDQVGFTVSL
jgi:hypothetical protein